MGPSATETKTADPAASTKIPLKLFWQDCPVKYTLKGGYTVHELKTPWDLYAEGLCLSRGIGGEMNQVFVRNGLERVFSIRKDGVPGCDILTKPVKAPYCDWFFGARRVFETSTPMIVDDQKLVVLEVLGEKGRTTDLYLSLARDFFLAHGGKLRGENPRKTIYTNKEENHHWWKMINLNVIVDIMFASEPIKHKEVPADMIHAPNADVGIVLLGSRIWGSAHFMGTDPWVDEIFTYMESHLDDLPKKGMVIHNNAELLERAKKLYERVEK